MAKQNFSSFHLYHTLQKRMDKDTFIKCKEMIPDTHFFIYRNQKYPIKFDYFKYTSNYFFAHQEEIKLQENIQLLDSKTEKMYIIPEKTIKDFINFVQRKKVKLSTENAVDLNYLSKKYEVTNLQEITDEYIINHKENVILDILYSHQIEKSFDSSKYETIISKNIIKYIDDDRLLKLNIPVLHRILKQHFEDSKNDDNDKIFDFLFKCLDKHGREASVLFEKVEFGENEIKYLNRLIQDYSSIFDIQYIKSSIIKLLVETEKEKKLQFEEYERSISVKNGEINKMKCENERLRTEINDQKQFMSTKIDEYEKKISAKKAELNQLNKEKEKQINDVKKQNQDLKNQVDELKSQLQKQIGKSKGNESLIPLLYKNENFNGIINYLTNQTSGNIHDNGTIQITSNSTRSGYMPRNLLDFNDSSYYWASQDNDVWVCFDFKTKKIKLTHYSIKSTSDPTNKRHLRSWKVEISNDGESWRAIDEQKDCPTLNGSNFSGTFSVAPNDFSRYVRLYQTNYTWDIHHNHVRISSIEFYGYLSK